MLYLVKIQYNITICNDKRNKQIKLKLKNTSKKLLNNDSTIIKINSINYY